MAEHGPSFERWFPSTFDWRAICGDAPQMAIQAQLFDPDADEASRRAVSEAAGEYLRLGYLGGLASLAVRIEDAPDPEGQVSTWVEELEDDAEARFADLAANTLDALEAWLAQADDAPAQPTSAPPGAAEAHPRWLLAQAAWAPLATWLADSAPQTRTRLRPVLVGFARLGAALASVRVALPTGHAPR